MANYILVPFNSSDQIKNTIPRIDKVAQTGMTVIFLTPYHVNGFFKNRRIRAELSSKDIPTDRNALMKYSYKEQTRLADEKTSVAGEALRQRGIKVFAYVHMGPLRRLLKSYRRNGGVHRVLMRRGNAIPTIAFLRRVVAFFSVLERFNSVPYLYYWREI